MIRVYFVVASIAIVFSSPLVQAQDFRLEGTGVQSLDLEGIEQVVLECYCSDKIVVSKRRDVGPKINFTAVFDSVGYHGSGENPQHIPANLMHFNTRKAGDTLYLESTEWMHIHTGFTIKEIELFVPQGIELRTVTIPFFDLEDRHLRDNEEMPN